MFDRADSAAALASSATCLLPPRVAMSLVPAKNIDRNHTGAGTGTEIQLVSRAGRPANERRESRRTREQRGTARSREMGGPPAGDWRRTHAYRSGASLCVVQLSNADNTCGTLVVHGEDHTLGNSFRYVLAKSPNVDFVGYTIPHPSEMKINMRIQTKSQRGRHDTQRTKAPARQSGMEPPG